MSESFDTRPSSRASWALSLTWAAVTALLLLLPGNALPGGWLPEWLATAVELSVHLALFFVLARLATRGLSAPSGRPGDPAKASARRARVLSAVLAYCVVLEILQIPIAGRGFEWIDIAMGFAGALLGARATPLTRTAGSHILPTR